MQRKKLFSSPRDAAQAFFSSAFWYLSLQGNIKGMCHIGIMTHIVDILAQFFLDNFHLYLPKTFTDTANVVRHIMVSHIPSLKSLTEVAKTE